MEAWAVQGGPGRFWEDKPNAGYSGTPLWKLRAEREAQLQLEQEGVAPAARVPEGFVKQRAGDPDFYWSDRRQVFWKQSDGRFYVWDDLAQKHVELHEAQTHDIAISVGGVCHERGTQVRHVIVRDLVKAAQALRLPIEHLDQPCALYALYDGHRGTGGNVCADFCAKHLHTKLVPKLAAFRGYWIDERLKAAVRESFEELDATFAEKHPGTSEGCSAAVALVVGGRVVVASLGDIVCCACLRSGETVQVLRAHALPDPDAEDSEEDKPEAPAAASSSTTAVRWTRSFGDLDLKAPAGAAALSATPDVEVLQLEQKYHGFALLCRALYASIGGGTAVSTVFRRSAGRPRMAAGALVDAAVQWLGQVEAGDSGLASVVAFLEPRLTSGTSSAAASGPGAQATMKRRRLEEPAQVRLRHILLKHRECKSTIDKVRNKRVRRTRGEAERILRGVFEECESDGGRKIFTQRCRELSECQSCLKAGDLAGDMSWVKRGSQKTLGEAFEDVVFALQVNQLSDLVDSEQGVHIVLRTA